MHISELRVRNFRNFLSARFLFRKGVNTLIGENGSGKTNALYALRLPLDDSLSRNATHLRETDFCRALENWRGHWIIISVNFEELDSSEGCQLLKHEAGHMDGSETGTYTLYFRPKLDARMKLHEMGQNHVAHEDIRQFLNGLTVDDYEAVFTGRAAGDFLSDTMYQQVVGDFANCVFPNPNDEDQNVLGVRLSGAIYSEFTCTFAQALRDVISDLRGYRTNPLLTLLRGAEQSIEIEEAEGITNRVAELNTTISNLSEIKNIANGVQITLFSTVGHTYSPSVSIESALPDNLENLLQRLTIRVGDDPETDYQGDMVEQSLGGANLIYLALKLLEYEVKLSSDRVAHFLLIEEPEAHIHTHIQKTLFEHQAARKTQVIVSTHSTHISSAARIRSVNVLARRKDHAEVYQPAQGLDDPAAGRVERYLDAVRSTLLFAKGVILVEGEAELVMIPAMIKAVFGLSPDEMGISVIAMDSAFFEHIAVVFHQDRIRRRCSIVTDLDRSFVDLPDDPADDNLEQKHLRTAQTVGEHRRELLEAFTHDNPWVQAFYAENTFEIDFLTSGNVSQAEETVDTLYSQAAARQRSKEALRSGDLPTCGNEILRLANKAGKGWFALLLSERLKDDTIVPEYILRAVAFAAENLSPDAIKRIGVFRLNGERFDPVVRVTFPGIDNINQMTSQEFMACYRERAQEDALTEFIGYMEEYSPE